MSGAEVAGDVTWAHPHHATAADRALTLAQKTASAARDLLSEPTSPSRRARLTECLDALDRAVEEVHQERRHHP